MLDPSTLSQLRSRKADGAPVDRASQAHARRVLEQLLPLEEARRAVAQVWASGIRAAHAQNRRGWSASLFPRSLRLTVGRLLVAEVLPGHLWLVVLDDASRAAELAPWRVQGADPFRVLDTPHHFVAVPELHLGRLASALAEVLERTARTAASTARQTGYRGSWSSGVVELVEATAGSLPRPDWLGEEETPPPPGRFDFTVEEIAALDVALARPRRSREQIERWRDAFLQRFGPEPLARLSGRALLYEMHGRASRDSMAYWLEYKQDDEFSARDLGSIAGGSPLKFGFFQRADEEGNWVTGSATDMRTITEDEATAIAEQQRDELLAAWTVVEALPDDPADDAWAELDAAIAVAAPSIHQLAFAHKVLSLWHPERVDDYHNVTYQRHVMACMGVVLRGTGLYDAASRYVYLLQRLRQTHPDLVMGQLTAAMVDRYGAPHGHWRVGTTAGEVDLWPPMRDGDVVAIGWDEIGDLTDLIAGLQSKEARAILYDRLQQRWPDTDNRVHGRSARQLWTFFHKIQEGDLVYAARGQTILGVGRVTGSYRYDDEAPLFRHRRAIRWQVTEALPDPCRTGLQTTVYSLGSDLDVQVAAHRAMARATPTDRAVSPARTPASRALGPIEVQLERKGQVILYGPPGTGKTWHALQAAQNIAAQDAHGTPWSALTDEQKRRLEKDPAERRIWMCTFHPAYGYEDFVEGLKPEQIDGQLTFEPQPGLFRRICERAAKHPDDRFVLVVDEFNRGDAPRIFGELLTLLELDKRDKPVDLPISRATFTIPRNVRLIGTMNTADRSIAHLDAALRRRFGFLEFLPDPEVLAGARVDDIPLDALLAVLNERLLSTLGSEARNLQVGHAYLMKDVASVRALRNVFVYDILPLLQEYCADEPGLLAALLGETLYDREARRLRPDIVGEGQELALAAALREWDPARLVPDDGATDDDEEPDEDPGDA